MPPSCRGPRRPDRTPRIRRPDLPNGAALLRTSCSEVCGTDVHLWHGRLAGVPVSDHPWPRLRRCRSTGARRDRGIDGSSLREGDRARLLRRPPYVRPCRACTVTRTPTRCDARRVYGITDSATRDCSAAGRRRSISRPGVADRESAGAVAARRLHRRRMRPADGGAHHRPRHDQRARGYRLVQGVGRSGSAPLRWLRLAGASIVIAIGAPEVASRSARRWGPTRDVHLDPTSPASGSERVRAPTHGEGADIAIEAAGSPRAIEEGLDLARDGGRYIVAGHYTDAGPARSTRTITSTASTLKSGAAGAASPAFSPARSRVSSVTADIPWRRSAPGRYRLSTQRRARGRRADAHSQSAGGSVGVTRHTKIIATIGPASRAPERIAQLISAGVDVFRLNFSHGSRESHAQVYRDIQPQLAAGGTSVFFRTSVVRRSALDRCGMVSRSSLREGDELRLAAGDGPGGPVTSFTPYTALILVREPGRSSAARRQASSWSPRGGNEIVTRVVHGGPLGEHEGINAPGSGCPPARSRPRTLRTCDSAWSSELISLLSASCRRQTMFSKRERLRIAPGLPFR